MASVTSTKRPRLEWIEVRGFRAFGSEARRLDLTSRLIVIHAGNSHGKTSLAEAAEWLITGRSSRRDLFGGAKAEYNASLRNVHLPPDGPVWVAAGVRDADGNLRTARRDLVADFSGSADCESQLTVDGHEATSFDLLGFEPDSDAIAAPVLLQHTLRHVLSTEPKQRATYFKALLSLSDLDLLRARVKAQITTLEDVPPGPGAAAVQRLARTQLASVAVQLGKVDGDRAALRRAIEVALLEASAAFFDAKVATISELQTALELVSQAQDERLFPVNDLAASAIPDLPPLPDLSRYLDEARRVRMVENSLLPVLTAIAEAPDFANLEHSVDCPVCLTPNALSADRIAQIQHRLRSTEHFAAAAAAAERALGTFQLQVDGWVSAVQRARPVAAQWGQERSAEIASVAADLGGGVPELLPPATTRALELDEQLLLALDAVMSIKTAAGRLAEHVRRREDVPPECEIDTSETRSVISEYRKRLAEEEPMDALRRVAEPIVRSRRQAEGMRELSVAAGLIDEIADERHASLQRTSAAKRLARADRTLQRAAAAVLDERFAAMSGAIERWWNTIRPEELVRFAGVKRRASGAVFVNLVGALQSDMQSDAIERDALGVFSDSQLNALGLSTFLARTQLVGSPFVFSDDPIPGSDGDHRLTFVQNTLADLLASDVQVVITTYDPKLAEHAQTLNEAHEPIAYELTLSNIAEGTEPSQTSDLFSNYMLHGEDGVNAPTAAGRANASGAYRRAAERLAKQIIATNLTAHGAPTTIEDVEGKAAMLGELIPLLAPYALTPDEIGKWKVLPKVLNPGNHDDGAPSTAELKIVRGNLRTFAKAHRAKWGSTFIK